MLAKLITTFTIFLAIPLFAQDGISHRTQMNAHVVNLCDADPVCMENVRKRLRDHCGKDKVCMRNALQRAYKKRDAANPDLSDLPKPVQDLVRSLLTLGREQRDVGGSGSARERMADLPPKLRNRISLRCGSDTDCIREALERARERRDEKVLQQAGLTPEKEAETKQPETSTETSPSKGAISGTEEDTANVTSPRPDRDRRPGANAQIHSQALDNERSHYNGGKVFSPDRTNDEPDPVIHGKGRTTWVSGSKDDRVKNLWAPDNGWLIGIRMSEKSDDPCDLDAFFATEDFVTSRRIQNDQVDGDGSSRGLAEYFRQCGDSNASITSAHLLAFSKTSNTITLDYPYAVRKESPFKPPHAINGIQVCQRRSNDLVKGLRIFGVDIDLGQHPIEIEQILWDKVYTPSPSEAAKGAVPKVIKVPGSPEFDRPNCNEWGTLRMCPDGQVGIGIEVHYNKARSGRSQITGLALHCAELTR